MQRKEKTPRRGLRRYPLPPAHHKRQATPRPTSPHPPAHLPPDIPAYHAPLAPSDPAIRAALAAIIAPNLRAPGATIESKVWHRHPVWFIDGNPIVGYHKLKDCVRLLFWSGQSFDEPGLAPEGSFKAAEARLTDARDINATNLKRWLKKAAAIQWDYKNIVKRKGKLERLN